MLRALDILWESALSPFLEQARPDSILMVGAGEDISGKVLDFAAPWNGKIHLAAPASGDYADLISRGGDRFTLHRASGRDAAGILPAPDIALITSHLDWQAATGGLTWQAATGLLHALDRQARRAGRPYPVTLIAGLAARETIQDAPQGHDDPRNGMLSALEDFVADQAPRLLFSVLPLLDGFAVLVPRDLAARQDARGLLDTIAMGQAARLVAFHSEADRAALEAARTGLQTQLAHERYRNGRLHAALRQAQSTRRQEQGQPAPASARQILPLRAATGLGRAILARARPGLAAPEPGLAEREISRLRDSRIFDAAWYLRTYPDIEASGVDPAEHYYWHGAAEGRDPGPYFVTAFYLASQVGASQAGGSQNGASQFAPASQTADVGNPVLHYLSHGARERRDPCPDFNTGFYLDANPDVAESGWNPLEHYLATGLAEGRRAHPDQ
jgi:hypothetical protein